MKAITVNILKSCYLLIKSESEFCVMIEDFKRKLKL
jgi:hypothetical protein